MSTGGSAGRLGAALRLARGERPGPTPLVRADRRPRLLVAHMTGLGLLFVSTGMALSALVELGSGGTDAPHLALPAAASGLAGLLLWRGTAVPWTPSIPSVFAAVAGAWLGISVAGALPFVLSGSLAHWESALFESVSGFTGTGATVLAPIEGTSRGILFWRSLTQWYGGMGVIVLAVAVLPFLGVGGLDLIRAEAPGPTSDRLAPRVRETAKRLWLVYGGFTLLAVAALLAVGLSPYDAVTHAFTVVSTGGFSPYDLSIGHFDSVAVEAVLIVLMLAGAVNFALHWRAVTGRPVYWGVSEFRFYIGVFVASAVGITLLNVASGMATGFALRQSTFTVASLLTSTGFGSGEGGDFVTWAPAAQLVLLGLMVTGGMAGSTSGGVKLLRVQVMLKHALRELRRVQHPRAVLALRLGRTAVDEDVVRRVVGFVLLYVVVAATALVLLTALGTDIPTSAGAVVSSIGNTGPALGDAGPMASYAVFTRPAQLVLCGLMLLGRLELFSVLLALGWVSQVVRGRHGELVIRGRGGAGRVPSRGWR